jgi:hypothetical protein
MNLQVHVKHHRTHGTEIEEVDAKLPGQVEEDK